MISSRQGGDRGRRQQAAGSSPRAPAVKGSGGDGLPAVVDTRLIVRSMRGPAKPLTRCPSSLIEQYGELERQRAAQSLLTILLQRELVDGGAESRLLELGRAALSSSARMHGRMKAVRMPSATARRAERAFLPSCH